MYVQVNAKYTGVRLEITLLIRLINLESTITLTSEDKDDVVKNRRWLVSRLMKKIDPYPKFYLLFSVKRRAIKVKSNLRQER